MQERVVDPITGKPHLVSVKILKDTPSGRNDARIKLTAKINASKPTNLCLSDLFERCLAEQERTLKQSTVRRNKNTYDRLVVILGNPLLSKLSAGLIRERLLQTGGSPGKLNEYLVRVKAALRWGYRNDLITDKDVIDKLFPFKEDVSKKEKLRYKFLETHELTALLSGMNIELWKLTTEFMALSGLRFGEVAALTDADVTDHIHINKTYDPINETTTTPKTFDSNRDVFIQPELSDCVSRIRALMSSRSSLFLSDSEGKHIEYYSFNKYLKENSLRILGRPITTHVLRHTHVSLLAAQGVPLDVISRRLGHEDSRVTRDIYMHVTAEMKSRDEMILSRVNLLS